jgi:hypothetical protein
MALYGLLGLRGGEFNLLPFAEPPQRTISGHYEFLLMEAARLTDEGSNPFDTAADQSQALEIAPVHDSPETGANAPVTDNAPAVRTEEILLASGSGTILHEWQCADSRVRLSLLQHVEEDAAVLSKLLPAGCFERSEIRTPSERIVCRIQAESRLFVRTTQSESQTE